MSREKVLLVIDENDAIIEQIPCNGFNFSQQRDLEKQTKKRHSPKKVILRFGVSEELFHYPGERSL